MAKYGFIDDEISENNSEYCTIYLPQIYKDPKELRKATKKYLAVLKGDRTSFDDPFGEIPMRNIRKIKI